MEDKNIVIMPRKNATEPGEFMFWPIWPNNIYVYVNCIKCKENILLGKNHTTTINKNGTVTVDPSILHEPCGSHFWIKENKIIV